MPIFEATETLLRSQTKTAPWDHTWCQQNSETLLACVGVNAAQVDRDEFGFGRMVGAVDNTFNIAPFNRQFVPEAANYSAYTCNQR